MRILGIESSCDDSAVALLVVGRGVVAHATTPQSRLHRDYGGVVPELASRDHVAQLLPLVLATIGRERPDAVACTTGPGLAGCLAAGVGLAQSLAYGWQVPLAQVNHLEGHLLSPFLAPANGLGFPYLALLVSGGHTALYDVVAHQQYRRLGTTLDDAAGEAFDKTGILLGLDFPGGPQLERLARRGNAAATAIPPAMQRHATLDFSFSGLKAAARRRLAAGHRREDIAAAFQEAAVTTLTHKTAAALSRSGRKRLVVVGGVGRNTLLRRRLRATAKQHGAKMYHPPMHWCTDNAAMIAYAGAGRLGDGYGVSIMPRWPLEALA